MDNIVVKIGCFAIIVFHLFWLILGFMFGGGILFGHRYFDDVIRTFNGTQIMVTIVSLALIFKNKPVGFVLLAITILSTYIIELGHWMF